MTGQIYVLDASVILAALLSEPGGEILSSTVATFHVSTVNLTECLSTMAIRGFDVKQMDQHLQSLDLKIEDFVRTDAIYAAMLRPLTQKWGLGLGDRACLALAKRLGLPVLTADTAWRALTLDVDIKFIR
jgi:ribonuclease VapC